jgi:two-component system copper resistance phosphate regulon response regulator CusR
MLPRRDGLEILTELRRGKNHVPVLMLTARDAVEQRVRGLDAGADDYLIKPFAFAELVARVRSLLRRGMADRETFLKYGDLEVDLLERKVLRAGRPVDLRSREYEVLVYLLRHQEKTVNRDRLGRDVWHEPDHALTNVIDVTMTNLRKALDRPGLPSLIQTVRGVGFVLRAEP